MNVMFLQDYKDDYRQYNNGQYGEIPDFVGYRLLREKIAVRAGFLVFIDRKRENFGNDLVSINEAVKRISNGCFFPNPEIMLRLYAPTSINDYDWVGYTDYDFEFIKDIIQALPEGKRLQFWHCVYNQYHKYCTTKDYEQRGQDKKDFEERLQLIEPFNLYNACLQMSQTKRQPTIIYKTLQTETAPPETSSKQEKPTFFDILKANPQLEQCLEKAIAEGYVKKQTDCYKWTSPLTHLGVFAEVLYDKGCTKTKFADLETFFGVKRLPQQREKAFNQKNYYAIKEKFERLICSK